MLISPTFQSEQPEIGLKGGRNIPPTIPTSVKQYIPKGNDWGETLSPSPPWVDIPSTLKSTDEVWRLGIVSKSLRVPARGGTFCFHPWLDAQSVAGSGDHTGGASECSGEHGERIIGKA